MAMVTCLTCGEIGNFTRCPGEIDDQAEGRVRTHMLRTDEDPRPFRSRLGRPAQPPSAGKVR